MASYFSQQEDADLDLVGSDAEDNGRGRESPGSGPEDSESGDEGSEFAEEIIVAKDPDVVLITGTIRRLCVLVDSHILSGSCEFFRVLFSPSWKEGQKLAEAQQYGALAEIELPEDDADAMLFVLRHLHRRSADNPARPSPQLIKNIAIVTDKYDLVQLMTFRYRYLLEPDSLDGLSVEDLKDLTIAAVAIGYLKPFKRFSARLLLIFTDSFSDLFEDGTYFKPISQDVAQAIGDKREHCRGVLIRSLRSFTHDLRAVRCDCGAAAIAKSRFLRGVSPVFHETEMSGRLRLEQYYRLARTRCVHGMSHLQDGCMCPVDQAVLWTEKLYSLIDDLAGVVDGAEAEAREGADTGGFKFRY